MLSATELTSMRSVLTASLPETCTIQRQTLTRSATGGHTETWPNVATGVACRVSPTSRYQEVLAAAKITALSAWIVTLPNGQDVQVKDRIVYGARTLQVLAVFARSWELGRRVVCAEIT